MSNVIPIRPVSVSHGLIHILDQGDCLELLHESASGESFACLERFGVDHREAALRAALDALPTYAPCRLGEVPQWTP